MVPESVCRLRALRLLFIFGNKTGVVYRFLCVFVFSFSSSVNAPLLMKKTRKKTPPLEASFVY